MTEVFRVERAEDGEGPYRTLMYGNIHDGYDEVSSFGRHPCPWDDGLQNVHKDDYFGFASIDDLHTWFNDSERKLLHREGFHLAVYNAVASCVRHGRRQCIFDMSQATRVRVEALT